MLRNNTYKISLYFLIFLFLFLCDSGFKSGYSESLKKSPNIPKAKEPTFSNELSSIDTYKQFNSTIERFLKSWEIKGASIAIAKENKIVYAKGFGYANIEDSILVEPNSIFRIASASKLITAIAIMKLVEEGKISLSSKVFGEKGILNDPNYLDIRDYNTRRITVEHLLRHQGGWSRQNGDPMFMPLVIAEKMKITPPIKINSIIEFILTKHLSFQPGSRSSYSNFGYAVLGEIIAKVTNMSYEDYVIKNILNPIGITDMKLASNFYEDRADNEVKYYEQSDAVLSKSYLGTNEMQPSSYGGTDVNILGAAGGWIATSVDLLTLVSHVDARDNVPDILDSMSVAMMTTPINNSTSPIGWRKTSKYNKWWRTGTLAGNSTLIIHQPDGFDFVVITNTGTWKGPKFYFDIEKAMCSAMSKVKEWPTESLIKDNTSME